jgi:hypothetical protein
LRSAKTFFTVFIRSTLLICSVFCAFTSVEAADTENCLMCHKYRFLGRIDETGKRQNYNVDEYLFLHSLHGQVLCRECHTNVTKIPHDTIAQPVNCANECHMVPPFSKEKFSHKKIIETFNQSAHGVNPEDSVLLKEAKPNCKYCHMNPSFTGLSESTVSYEESLRRCNNCHVEYGVVQAYKHITHRLRHKTSRSPQEIVALCGGCHHDTKSMESLKVSDTALNALETYNQSIHGKLARLGSKEAADCVSCHTTNALHDIYKKDNINSTVYKGNLNKTCGQCHKHSNDLFVEIAVHPGVKSRENPFIRFASIALRFAIYGSVLSLVGLMILETSGRRKSGIKLMLRNGTTWRRDAKKEKKK